MLPLHAVILLFLIGISIGSFVNVLIDRIPKGIPVIRGRSSCDFCRRKLGVADLIPLISFFMLKGKCRYCKKQLSWQYPLVEFLTGFSFIIMAYLSVNGILTHRPYPLILILFLIPNLIAIFGADLKYRIIPDEILLVILFIFASYFILFQHDLLLNHFLSGAGVLLVFLFLVLITRGKGMGLGDVKYAFVMGFITGFPGVIVAFYTAFLTGAFVSLILILLRKKSVKSTLPFGPFLVVATLIAILAGDYLIYSFLRLTGI